MEMYVDCADTISYCSLVIFAPTTPVEFHTDYPELNNSAIKLETYTQTLSEILDLVEQMNEVDTDGIDAMAHPRDTELRLRADAVTERNQRDKYLKLAPASENGLFLVPKVLD
jgi:aspartyl-tRNA(Asn)/glutamyl-tRNA(Gln) amidotransferase subunit C